MKITFRWIHLLGGVPFLGVMYCHRCMSTPSELSIGLIFFEISFWFTKTRSKKNGTDSAIFKQRGFYE